jgi:membrane protease YdiL (CAAX protease family)
VIEEPSAALQAPGRAVIALAVAFAMIFPTATAWTYFLALGGSGQANFLQQFVYGAGKAVQFAFPLVFVLLVEGRWPVWQRPTSAGLLLGVGFGVLVAAILLLGYHAAFRSLPVILQAGVRLRGKMEEFGVAAPLRYLVLSVLVCCGHSFLEEYYWRWFVFGRLRALLPLGLAVALSSLGFMAHHVLIVWVYLPDRMLTGIVPASLAVAAGGAVWALLYNRAGSLLAPWVSHGLVDAALFAIGWDMMQHG